MKFHWPATTSLLAYFFFATAVFTTIVLAILLGRDQNIPKSSSIQSDLTSTSTTMGGEKLPAMNGGNFNHYNTVAPKEEKVFPLFNNTGKTAIVSGAGAGIGLTVAQALAESGANVAIWYHGNKKALDRAHDIEKEYGVKCMCNVGTKTLTNAVAPDS